MEKNMAKGKKEGGRKGEDACTTDRVLFLDPAVWFQYGLLRQATNLTVVMTTLKTFPYIAQGPRSEGCESVPRISAATFLGEYLNKLHTT